jgi:hypothetical protein
MRQIEEIEWEVEGGASGYYIRDRSEPVGDNARKVVVIGLEHGGKDIIEESWLVFSREVRTNDYTAGSVEIAFAWDKNANSKSLSVYPIGDSRLVVFFPTIVPTNLGFIVQGPFRTTPSRDNIPHDDPWNQHLVKETATLLVEALRSLRNFGVLDTGALCCLPLDRARFSEGSMFAPLFDAVRNALASEPLLPTFGGGYASAKSVRLSRTQELRELISPSQLTALFGEGKESFWLSEAITQDRTPGLRQYLMGQLEIVEATPEALLPKLTKTFLEQQSDEWIRHLYEFLYGQTALLRQGRLKGIPLVRLKTGCHVTPMKDGQPQAFLPGPIATDFPTVRSAVCETEAARAMLLALGLTEPDPVDDVVRNILPKYTGRKIWDECEEVYEADIRRILTAFRTDSKGQREKLLVALRESNFVKVVDAGDGSSSVAKPIEIYIATQRLKELFERVPSVLLVDDTCSCLRGDDVRDLLEACGATRYLQPEPIDSCFTGQDLLEMRTREGTPDNTGISVVEDFTLRGLDPLLMILAKLDTEQAARKAELLWDALCDVEDRRGTSVFMGTYKWFYYRQRGCVFDAAFVRHLTETAWVPDRNGALQPPRLVIFEETGWRQNPFLITKLQFKPPIMETLAKEAGIEPGVLDLLKKLGLTSEAELRTRLGIREEPQQREGETDTESVEDALKELLGDAPTPTPPVPNPEGPEQTGAGGSRTGASESVKGGTGAHRGSGPHAADSVGEGGKTAGTTGDRHTSKPEAGSARPFISYLGVHPAEENPDPDGLGQQARIALEEAAIKLILKQESAVRRTPTNNPGFDLVELGPDDKPVRWIEVKAMTGDLKGRPVGLSRTQFETARERGDRYWLYVVEQAGSPEVAHILRIQDPAGKARTFTFDHGWLAVAEGEDENSQDRGQNGEDRDQQD